MTRMLAGWLAGKGVQAIQIEMHESKINYVAQEYKLIKHKIRKTDGHIIIKSACTEQEKKRMEQGPGPRSGRDSHQSHIRNEASNLYAMCRWMDGGTGKICKSNYKNHSAQFSHGKCSGELSPIPDCHYPQKRNETKPIQCPVASPQTPQSPDRAKSKSQPNRPANSQTPNDVMKSNRNGSRSSVRNSREQSSWMYSFHRIK